ncbi:MAG: cupin domain-containing protein [Planctomycetota bacterium]|jgi:quercetin dioxygenase-like cupin family protein
MSQTTQTPLIRNTDTTTCPPTDMPGASRVSLSVMIGREDGAPHFAMRQICVEPGGHTPRHSHDYEHEVVVLDGQGTLLLHGQEHPIKKGDCLYVPADEEHQFKPTGDSTLRFLCLVPVDRNCGDPTPGS